MDADETLNKTWHMTPQQWHQSLRKAFRTHLFQFVGSYEMAIFFLVAPFNNENLLVFRQCDTAMLTREELLEQCKTCVRGEITKGERVWDVQPAACLVLYNLL